MTSKGNFQKPGTNMSPEVTQGLVNSINKRMPAVSLLRVAQQNINDKYI